MRIGLLRHFPVDQSLPSGWRTSGELQAWRVSYDQAAPQIGPFELSGVDWQACISSDMERAAATARAVFGGDVMQTPLLREGEFAEFRTGKLRLPVWAWRQVLRLTWMTGHSSQRACRDEFMQRVRTIADQLVAADRDTLVVSHAGMMAYLSSELRRRGFAGPKLRIAKHAVAYVYEQK